MKQRFQKAVGESAQAYASKEAGNCSYESKSSSETNFFFYSVEYTPRTEITKINNHM